ncbi:MAG: septal ring lytic transglycosylase RlpA family protein [Luteimonas sp.]|nr:septal ring lytic transglycosylase RlpA family protein [Luteimonas sp.]
MRRWLPAFMVLLLAACAGTQNRPGPPPVAGAPAPGPGMAGAAPPDCTGFVPYPAAQEDPATRGDYVAGGLYKPGVSDSTPDEVPRVDCIREPDVVALPRSAYGNRSPYRVLGKSYEVLGTTDGYVETGLASYYGNKFHGRRTSNHEVYDMYAFTAAHKSLPLPSFARVTNLENGRSVVVRVNDRGPFHDGRVIDLSYAAAVKLDIHRRGTGRVEVRALQPGEVPAVARAPQAASVPAPAKASGLDSLVDALPKGAVAAPVMLAAASPLAPTANVGAPAAYARAADHPSSHYGRDGDSPLPDGRRERRDRTADGELMPGCASARSDPGRAG